MTGLADRKCKPCEGGVEPLDGARAESYLRDLHDDWRLVDDRRAIERVFDFPAFGRTMAFANAVAWVATVEGHHPVMEVSYSRCVLRYTTHAIGGLSENDFICAARVDRLAADA